MQTTGTRLGLGLGAGTPVGFNLTLQLQPPGTSPRTGLVQGSQATSLQPGTHSSHQSPGKAGRLQAGEASFLSQLYRISQEQAAGKGFSLAWAEMRWVVLGVCCTWSRTLVWASYRHPCPGCTQLSAAAWPALTVAPEGQCSCPVRVFSPWGPCDQPGGAPALARGCSTPGW